MGRNTIYAKTTYRNRSISLRYDDKYDMYFWKAKSYPAAIDVGLGELYYDSLAKALSYAKRIGLIVQLSIKNFTEEQLTYYQRMV